MLSVHSTVELAFGPRMYKNPVIMYVIGLRLECVVCSQHAGADPASQPFINQSLQVP